MESIQAEGRCRMGGDGNLEVLALLFFWGVDAHSSADKFTLPAPDHHVQVKQCLQKQSNASFISEAKGRNSRELLL